MTWLWGSLIVIGIVMIAVALWPGARGRGEPEPEAADDPKPDGLADSSG